jgi:hypothetical protein
MANIASIKGAPWMWKLALAIPAVTAQAQIPVVDCAILNSQTGQVTAFFGYTANTNAPTTIPLGASNSLDGPATLYGSIPVIFPQQSAHVLFSVKFIPPQTVAWNLNGMTATASAQSVASPVCQTVVGTTLVTRSKQRCWDTKADNTCDINADRDGDGYCTILDCAGSSGSQGAQGATGVSGNTGPAGSPGTAPLFQTVSASPGAASATASCGTNQFLVTGAGTCTVPNLPDMGRLASSVATADRSGWSVSCSAGQATAVAICAPTQ